MVLALDQLLRVLVRDANACLTCGDFRTTIEFLDVHKEELERTNKLLDKARANGWQRQVEMNEQIKTNLESVIKGLEDNEEQKKS